MKSKSKFLLIAGFILSLALLGSVALLNWQFIHRMEETAKSVAHTEKVNFGLSKLLSGLQDIETGARGFVITGDPKFLEPFEASLSRVDDLFRTVRTLISDPHQRASCDALEPLIAQRIAAARALVELRRKSGFEVAQQDVVGAKGKVVMDQIRAVITRMETEEQSLLDQCTAAAKRASQVAIQIAVVGTGLSFVLLVVVFGFVTQENWLRDQAEQALRKTNEQLEQRVRERTAKLEEANTCLQSAIRTRKEAESGIRKLNAELEQRVKERTAEVQASQERFQIMARATNDVVWDWNLLTNNVWWNEAFQTVFGYRVWDIEPGLESWTSRIHPDDAERVVTGIHHAIDTGAERWFDDYRFRRADGSFAFIFDRGEIIRDGQGKAVRMVGAIMDMTERRKAENERDRFFTLSTDMLCIAGTDAHFKRVNPAFNITLGYTTEELLAQPFLNFVHPDDRAATVAEVEKLSHGIVTIRFENRYRCRNGAWKWLSWNVQPLSDEGLLYCTARDVTGRKRAEEVRALQTRIANIFLTMPDNEMFNEVLKVILDVMRSPFGVFGFIDEDGSLVVPTMTRQIWDKCQIPEKTIRFPRPTWGDSSWPQAIREKKANYSNENSTKAPLGHVIVTRHISLPILFQGEVIGLFQVANKETDYTEDDIRTLETIAGYIAPILSARLRRERAEESVRKLNSDLLHHADQLQQTNKELESFSYSVAHDLRTPMRAINGFGANLLKGYGDRLDDEGRRIVGVMRSEAERMGELIDGLLEFSRMGRTLVQTTEVDMNALAQSVYNECAALAADRKLQFKLHPLPPAQGDPDMLRHVWTHLISNAVKYTRTKPVAEIEITGTAKDGEIVYCVKDNGVGFDMRYANKLFGVFQRLHSEDEFEGVGIGLALVKRIIHRHEGRIWVESTLNAGTAFYFALPLGKE
ncbi:MAG: CHASE3 domain-containing protein [Verrucomicrobia bacterium]|nr:CHASE3 domain-containing protein [Verrucomicrobiota bacterium]